MSMRVLPSEDGQKMGVDDYLLTHTVTELEHLLETPRRASAGPPYAAYPQTEQATGAAPRAF